MKIKLAEPLATYFEAEARADTDILGSCFADDAVVRDERRTHQGLDAIKAWKREARAKYQYSVEPLSVSQQGQDATVLARLAGNFPGSPVELTYTFAIVDGKIAALEIR